MHVASPFGFLDLHYGEKVTRGTLLLDAATVKRRRSQSILNKEEKFWLSLISARFCKDQSIPLAMRVIEAHGLAMYWQGIEEDRIEWYIDPDWKQSPQVFSRASEYEFHLVMRTAASEVYAIWPCEQTKEEIDFSTLESTAQSIGKRVRTRVGGLHLHFEGAGRGGDGTIIVEQNLRDDQTNDLIDSVGQHLLGGCGTAFSINVVTGCGETHSFEYRPGE